MLVCTRSDINEVSICVELHERSELVQGVRRHARDNPDIPLQLEIVRVEYCVRLPLFSHIARVLECGELCSERFEWFNVREGRTFRHLPSSKRYEDQELAKVELIALILSFAAIQFQLVD
jgi:hypothetical protein